MQGNLVAGVDTGLVVAAGIFIWTATTWALNKFKIQPLQDDLTDSKAELADERKLLKASEKELIRTQLELASARSVLQSIQVKEIMETKAEVKSIAPVKKTETLDVSKKTTAMKHVIEMNLKIIRDR
ncbi:MAG: hypothetical protein FWE48_07530 [Coriobacteriia bacterium]|nr:hypothetical protein [Coriobacteriia bacterium]